MEKFIETLTTAYKAVAEAVMSIIKSCQRLIWGIRYTRAVKKADKLSQKFRLRYYVLYAGGRLKVVPKQTIKRLIQQGRFKSGTKIQDVENIALYVTPVQSA
jgi:hypothetical protein